MKRLLSGLIALISAGLTLAPLAASAHTLQVSGPIGITYHLDPDDDPVVGHDVSLQFVLEDTSNQFSADQCDCTLIIRQNNHPVARKTFSHNTERYGNQALVTNFNFPQRDVYTLQLIGKPQAGSHFQPFDITWSQRVAHTTAYGVSESAGQGLTAIVGLIALALGALTMHEIGNLKHKVSS